METVSSAAAGFRASLDGLTAEGKHAIDLESLQRLRAASGAAFQSERIWRTAHASEDGRTACFPSAVSHQASARNPAAALLAVLQCHAPPME